jgi:integrase
MLPSGERASKCFSRKVDAEAWEARVRTDMRHGSGLLRQRKRFFELAAIFNKDHAGSMMAESSRLKYEAALRMYITPYFDRTWIDQISKVQVVEFRSAVDSLELSKSMKHFLFSAFKTVMKKAVEWDLLDRNPADSAQSLPKGMAKTDYWTESEVSKFLDFNRGNPHLPLFIIALNTGMRIGEIMGLRWKNVDLEHGIISICEVYCQKLNAVKPTTKSQRPRQIGINPVVNALLVELKRTSKSEFVMQGEGYRTRAYHFSRIVKAACRHAGVQEITFHDFRHTFATQFVMNNGSIHALSGTLGHTAATMTTRYAHFGPEHAKRAAQVVSFKVPDSGSVLPFGQRKQNLEQNGQDLVINP